MNANRDSTIFKGPFWSIDEMNTRSFSLSIDGYNLSSIQLINIQNSIIQQFQTLDEY